MDDVESSSSSFLVVAAALGGFGGGESMSVGRLMAGEKVFLESGDWHRCWRRSYVAVDDVSSSWLSLQLSHP